MMHRLCTTVVFLLLAAVTLFGRQPLVRVNGFEVSKYVTSVDMEDNVLSLHWNDNTVLHGRMAEVMVDLASRNCLDKAQLLSVSGLQLGSMRIDGLKPGVRIQIYDIMGNCVLNHPVDGGSVTLDLSKLNAGVYFAKCDNIVLKFAKG